MFKKVNVLLFLIIFLLGIVIIPGTVAAAGNGSVYVSTGGNDNWDGQSATYNNISGSGPKATIKNATWTVDTDGTVYVASGTYRENQINITKNMDIVGENKEDTIINGTKSGFIFNIQSGVYVTLAHLTLTEGQYEKGGAIVNNGMLSINDSIFTQNSAIRNGGAIYNPGTLTVINSIFSNNTAIAQIVNNGGTGGAIMNEGVLAVDTSIFHDNIAFRGGAIESYSYLVTPYLNVTNSVFESNGANYGGAISSPSGFMAVINNTFVNNRAYNAATDPTSPFSFDPSYNRGGAISGSTGVVNFNRFVGNTALSNNGNIISSTGNMDARFNWWGSNSLNLDYNDFDVRSGVFTYDPWIVLTVTVSPEFMQVGGVSNVTADLLHDNHGDLHDPAFGLVPYTGTAGFTVDKGIIINASFVDGVARTTLNTSGVLGYMNVRATVDGETVNQSVYVGVASVDPADGSIVKQNQNITIKFEEPIVAGPGYNNIRVTGKNGNQKNITITIRGNLLIITPVGVWDAGERYTLELPSDAVKSTTDYSLTQSLNSTFIVEANTIYVSTHGNDSWDGLTPETAKRTIKNAVNSLAANGTIYVRYGTYYESHIDITHSMKIIGAGRDNTIINGSSNGIIFNIVSGAVVTISDLTLTQGQRAIYNYGTLILNNTKFTNNTDYSGGAIYNLGTLTVYNSIFTNNNATSAGGAIYNLGTLTMHNSSFTNNHATGWGNGGAIYNSGSLNVNNTEFKDNTAGIDGGAIVNDGTASIKGSTFIGNSVDAGGTVSKQGGAIHNYGVLIIDSTTFTDNAATGDGGAIYSTGGSLTVNNSTFTNNTGNTGAISSYLGATITNSTFIGNTGAINGGNLIIDNSKFIDNSWVIVNDGLNDVYGDFGPSIISNSIFINNGRVISNAYGGRLKLINSTITGNNGDTLGIIFNGMKTGSNDPINEIDIINSVITGNTGSSYLIYNGDGRMTVTSSVISNNALTSDSSRASIFFNMMGEMNLHFNSITNNGGIYDVYSTVSSVYVDNNWWGSNNGTNRVYINRRGADIWLVLTPSLDDSVVNLGDSVNAVVNMWYNNFGDYLNPSNGHIPDGIQVNISSLIGHFLDSTVTLFNGMAETMFTPDVLDSGKISLSVGGQRIVEFIIHVVDGIDLNSLTSDELQELRDAFNVSRETGLQWIADYQANLNNTQNNTQNNNTQENNTDTTTNSSSSSDGSTGGITPGTGDGSPQGNDGSSPNVPQQPNSGQNPDTALSASGQSQEESQEGSSGESDEESVGDSGQSPKTYEVSPKTTSNSGTQNDPTLIAIIGVILLLLLVGVGFYFKK